MDSFMMSTGRKLFQKNLAQYQPADPLYETYVDKKGRERRRKRELPPGLSERDAKVLKSVKRRAHHLDKGFNLCGVRFGWTFIIGIVPGAGDVADAALNYYLVVRKARQAEIPDWLLRKMLTNNAVSAAAGFIPLLGDVVLAAFKANSRNAALLEEYLRIRGEEFLKRDQDRLQDPATVRPGAGTVSGEQVPGKVGANAKTSGGWFRRRSKREAKQLAANGVVAEPSQRESRFIEDVPEGRSKPVRK
ncbi:uncharacterized protein PHACADRAFT_117417 [Phanerochaete carnosa HHB-10118-sp]|uniref:DUF4112 domain-containing protein n=1 Tax=Phanerochaete carnosa (strain HHB-10118-sp) TaxID=650164 RepID=K5X6G5_PHACS|nr:uncharacterized protein PHACADRAFT_117417 [Phanerochaete carnosa HHB-10118-sp]EKM58447.1 hypothetical protein PHACADRAFT_117417 [Phanerochaete carnosa HHB-10118-sp]